MNYRSFTPNRITDPTPWIGHMPFGYWLVGATKPNVIVELGTHLGNSYFTFCQAVADHQLATKCYAIDTWEGDVHGGFYGGDICKSVNQYNSQHYIEFSSCMRMTFDSALQTFKDGVIDLLHIDGLHTYEAVRHDFESWQQKLSPNAIVLFHDTNVTSEGFGVRKYFQELKVKYKNHLEFTHSFGLGFIQIGSESIEKDKRCFHAGSSEQLAMIEYFETAGAALEKKHIQNKRNKKRFYRRALKRVIDVTQTILRGNPE